MGSFEARVATSEPSLAGDLDHGGLDAEAADGFGEAVVVGEDDDLAVLAGGLEDLGEAVDARGVHRLDGVVDDDEAERALGEGRARDEEAEGEGVELALAHHAEGGAFLAVDGDLQLDLPVPCRRRRGGRSSSETLLWSLSWSQMALVVVGDRGEALVADRRRPLPSSTSRRP